jgi:polar amino acid transport system permease protein
LIREVLIPLAREPVGAMILAGAGSVVLYVFLTSEVYQGALRFVWSGVGVTIQITIVGYIIALVIGLIAGLGRVSANRLFYDFSTLYVEIIRGIPMLVIVLYIGTVAIPAVAGWMGIGRVGGVTRAIIALAIGNGAHLAEVFRAGIEAIGRGQMEAARSLGMTYFEAMRYVILPQAIRVVLPPLGNEFILMLKDSSLAAALAITELTFLGKMNVSRTMLTFPSWNVVALLYLVLTLVLSLGVRFLEQRMPLE